MADRLPIRLVREDGETIDLTAHTVEMVVDKQSSAWTTPFTDSFKASIDLNMSHVLIEMSGTFIDDRGQEKAELSTAKFDFGVELPFNEPPGPPTGGPIFEGQTASNPNVAFAGFGHAGGATLPTIPPTTPSNNNNQFMQLMHNKYFKMPIAHWHQTGEPYGRRDVKFIFDAKRGGSVKEPHAYANRIRETNMRVASYNASTKTIVVSGADPREWIELTAEQSYAPVIGKFNENTYGQIKAVTSDSITFYAVASTPVVDDVIALQNTPLSYSEGYSTGPVIGIPIRHMLDETQPTHTNGASRDVGTATSPSEILAYIVSKALTSVTPDPVGGVSSRGFNTAGSGELASAFAVDISTGKGNQQTLLTVTQLVATELGAISGAVDTTVPMQIRFEHTGFTGGRAGNKVKSAGDKVQDIFGIVGNSQNFASNYADPNALQGAVGTLIEKLSGLRGYTQDNAGDYIYGVQIPYDSTVSKSSSETFAQRNFFLTTGKVSTNQKMSVINTRPAHAKFQPFFSDYRKSGIKAIITDFEFEHSGQSNVYDFTMKMLAVDAIL
jgi:hypothetical protein